MAEDVGLVVGGLLARAAARRRISRFASAAVPMDEALARCSLDVCGRGGLHFLMPSRFEAGAAPAVELALVMLDALARGCDACLHVDVVRGRSAHHVAEAVFKALGVCWRGVFERAASLSTKGTPLVL